MRRPASFARTRSARRSWSLTGGFAPNAVARWTPSSARRASNGSALVAPRSRSRSSHRCAPTSRCCSMRAKERRSTIARSPRLLGCLKRGSDRSRRRRRARSRSARHCLSSLRFSETRLKVVGGEGGARRRAFGPGLHPMPRETRGSMSDDQVSLTTTADACACAWTNSPPSMEPSQR